MSHINNVTCGITTHNRLNYLKNVLQSLQESVNINDINIKKYDDCSSEYNLDTLSELAPFAKERKELLFSDINEDTYAIHHWSASWVDEKPLWRIAGLRLKRNLINYKNIC